MITSYVTEINSNNFDEKINLTDKCIVYIKAPWCGPCKQLAPIIDEVSSELYEKVTVCRMDADENMDLLKTLNVRNIPTLLYYKNGEVIDRTVGVKSKNEIIKLVEGI